MKVRELRPRLDPLELRFLIHVLRVQESMLKLRHGEEEELEKHISKLRREFRRGAGYSVFKQLQQKRAQLAQLRAQQSVKQALICRDLARRFEGMLNGRKPHPNWLAELCLKELAT